MHHPMSHMECTMCGRRYPLATTKCSDCGIPLKLSEYKEEGKILRIPCSSLSCTTLITITGISCSMSSCDMVLQSEPSCPLCGCMLDHNRLSFSTCYQISGKQYYCNNPVCCKRGELSLDQEQQR